MTTITEENRKALRRAMRVECGFQESKTGPTAVVPINADADLAGLANIESGLFATTLMDLAGSGFLNDGGAIPMQTDSDSGRYGFISEETAKADGSFDNPVGVTVQADQNWDRITLQVRSQYGETKMIQVTPIWSGGQTTVYVDRWTPGERVYIIGVFLGLAWVWNNESLLSVTADLHSVGTKQGGELEVSSLEIQAYETTDYTDVIGRIQRGAPIYYTAGYDGNQSLPRRFYLSEPVTWDYNVLTIKGQDASLFLDDVELPALSESWGSDTNVNWEIADRIREALQTISYDTVGSVPVIGLAGPVDYLYERKPARSIISEMTGVFRDEGGLRVTYVDAGRPTLYFGNNGTRWTIYADEITEFNTVVEMQKNALEIDLPEYYTLYNANIEDVEATAGRTYFVDLDPPCQTVYITPTPTSSEEINSERFKFKAAATTTYTVSGYEMLGELLPGNGPFIAETGGAGEPFRFDFDLPLFNKTGGGSLTKAAIYYILNRSNITYEFTYRGNPEIQPRDVLEVEVATWETDQEETSGLFPGETLYPGADLYPDATYAPVRRMKKQWVTMTVDTVTLEHGDGGGLTSKIKARRGVV